MPTVSSATSGPAGPMLAKCESEMTAIVSGMRQCVVDGISDSLAGPAEAGSSCGLSHLTIGIGTRSATTTALPPS